MKATAYINGIVHALAAPFFSDSDPVKYGADDVQAAINEVSSITDREFMATLHEPTLENFGGFFQNDWKVLIGVTSTDYKDPSPLVFDLPRGEEDDEALLYVLMDAVGADEIADIEGAEVPMEVVGGNPMVFWDQINDPDEEDIDEPISEEEVDEIVESDVSPLDEAAGSISLWWHSSDGQATTDEM